MEKKIRKLKFNDVIEIDYNKLYVRRVYGGWIYEYTKADERQNMGGSYISLTVTAAVFVPE
jgi:hypothetical protein